MNTQFWKPITPVVGEKIPDGAIYGRNHGRRGIVEGDHFNTTDLEYEWRVPVEVVPIDLVLDLLMESCMYHWCHEKGRNMYVAPMFNPEITATDTHTLRELVTAKLREMAGGE